MFVKTDCLENKPEIPSGRKRPHGIDKKTIGRVEFRGKGHSERQPYAWDRRRAGRLASAAARRVSASPCGYRFLPAGGRTCGSRPGPALPGPRRPPRAGSTLREGTSSMWQHCLHTRHISLANLFPGYSTSTKRQPLYTQSFRP